jgi:hypothetical protein
MIEQEFVKYEEALALKKLGLDEDCFGYYHVNSGYTKGYAFCYFNKPETETCDSDISIPAPTFSQAFRWFRENYGLYSCIMYSSDGIIKGGYSPMIDVMKPHKATLDLNTYDIYEEAELACLRRLIEIVKTV